MNGDLISRSDLIEALRAEADECEESRTSPSFWTALKIVKEQPISYDVDKVVAELEELKAYRDAEEQGLLLKLPYPVGTPIYHVFKSQGVVKDRIRSWRYGNKGLLFCSRGNSLVPEAIGRSVFLTREEAEQALEKMKG